MATRILMTGHRGYIGSVMAPYLMERGYLVAGLDAGFFEPCALTKDQAPVAGSSIDLREVCAKDLEGFDAVVHLAALSNDPIGNLNNRWTKEINGDATIHLAKLARAAGVERFLFSSSCIMYGGAALKNGLVRENSPLDPRTQYARSKVDAEEALRPLAANGFSPVYMRNGTIYGLSPRMRFDTVLNSFAGSAIASGCVQVFSDGTPWRPVVHLEDVCQAFQAALESPVEAIHNQAFNVGAEFVNIQVGELARATGEAAGARVEVHSEPDADQRSYRTSFQKIKDHLPAFQPKWNPRDGAARLVGELRGLPLTASEFEDARFTRLRWLRQQLDSGHLTSELRWAQVPEVAPV